MAPNSPGVAEPAKRVAERPAGEERFITPQTRDESGGLSARPSTAASLKRARSGAAYAVLSAVRLGSQDLHRNGLCDRFFLNIICSIRSLVDLTIPKINSTTPKFDTVRPASPQAAAQY